MPFRSSDPRPAEGAQTGADALELSRHLRRLARQLVPDAATADDLVQEAWLAALDGPPERIRDLNSWLKRVVRNLAGRHRRRAARRLEAEALGAVEAVQEPESALVERLSVYNLVRRTVAELREPYRAVLTARFFDERSVDEIAGALGRPAETVRSQLRRGLAELRETLDRKHDGRRAAWTALLLRVSSPAGERAEGRPTAGSPGRALLWRSAAWLGVTVVAWWAWGSSGSSPRPAPDALTLSTADVAAASAPPTSPSPAAGARSVAADAALPPESAGAPTRVLEVLVRLPDGSPAPGAYAQAWNTQSLGLFPADADGRVRIEVAEDRLLGPPAIPGPDPGLRVCARAPGQVWSYRYNVPLARGGTSIELATRGPAQRVEGLVLDADGRPVADAHVAFGGEVGGVRRTAEGLPYGEPTWDVRTDEHGAFGFDGLSFGAHRVQVRAAGFPEATRLLEGPEAVLAARIVLPRGGRVVGTVRRPDGSLALGARVWRPDHKAELVGGLIQKARVDASGSFTLEGLAAGRQHVFAAEAQRPDVFASAVVEVPEGGSVAWDASLAPALGVHLRIEERTGQPAPRAIAVLYLEQGSPPWADVRYTDEEGRAAFVQVPEGSLGVLVKRSAADSQTTRHDELVPSAGEQVIRLPAPAGAPAVLTGSLSDATGGVPPAAFVAGAQGWETFEAPLDPGLGTFRVEDLDAGAYILFAVVPGRGSAALGTWDLATGEVHDLGPRTLPPPVRVELEWRGTRPGPGTEQVLWATFASSGVPDKRVLVLREPVQELELLPGAYRLAPAAAGPGAGSRFVVDPQPPNHVVVDR